MRGSTLGMKYEPYQDVWECATDSWVAYINVRARANNLGIDCCFTYMHHGCFGRRERETQEKVRNIWILPF